MILTQHEKSKLYGKPKKESRGEWKNQKGKGRGYTTRTLADGRVRYLAQGKVKGKVKSIGRFWTPEEAHEAYLKAVMG